jgi:transcriptional regulator with XRE-family HTH domain
LQGGALVLAFSFHYAYRVFIILGVRLEKIGLLIHRHRKHYRITLKEMAERTGLSISFLSEIERGVAKPSMDSLRKIARSLGISLLSFSDVDEPPETPYRTPLYPREAPKEDNYVTKVNVVRANHRKKLGYPDRPGFYELLSPDLNRKLEVLYVRIEPGFETGPEPIQDPPGEKFIYVIKGLYQMIINDETYVLEPGDSIYYPASASVFFKNIGDVAVELVFVLTPPVF